MAGTYGPQVACKLKIAQQQNESQQMAGNNNSGLILFLFSIHLDEIATAAEEAILIAYIQHTKETNSKQDIVMRMWKSHTTTPEENMFCAVDAYLRV